MRQNLTRIKYLVNTWKKRFLALVRNIDTGWLHRVTWKPSLLCFLNNITTKEINFFLCIKMQSASRMYISGLIILMMSKTQNVPQRRFVWPHFSSSHGERRSRAITESQHGLHWKEPLKSSSAIPCSGRDTFHQNKLFQAPSNWYQNQQKFFLFSVFSILCFLPQPTLDQAQTTGSGRHHCTTHSEKLSKSSMAGWLGLFLKNLRLLCPRTQPQGQGFGPCSFLWSLGILPNPHFRVRSRVYTLCAFNYTAIISWSYLYFLVLLLKSKPSLSH